MDTLIIILELDLLHKTWNTKKESLMRTIYLDHDPENNFLDYSISDNLEYYFDGQVPDILEAESEVIILESIQARPAGRGLGSKLMEKFLSAAQTTGIRYVVFNACPMMRKDLSKQELIAFYQKFGAFILEDHGPGALMAIDLRQNSSKIKTAEITDEFLKSLPPIQWRLPSPLELENELKSEYAIERLFITAQWPKPDDFKEALPLILDVATQIELDPTTLKGRHLWPNYQELYITVKSFGGPKDPESMIHAISNQKALPMPIVIKKIDGNLEVAGGNTRSGIAALAGQSITALVIDEAKAKGKLADKFEREISRHFDDEKSERIFNLVRDYYFNDGKKPKFKEEDLLIVILAEFELRRIQELRGLTVKKHIIKNT
jgi:GNAT superfamily N-acetyltransferase